MDNQWRFSLLDLVKRNIGGFNLILLFLWMEEEYCVRPFGAGKKIYAGQRVLPRK